MTIDRKAALRDFKERVVPMGRPAIAALQQLAKLDQRHRLLSREYGVVDLRLPDKLYLRKRSGGDVPAGPA